MALEIRGCLKSAPSYVFETVSFSNFFSKYVFIMILMVFVHETQRQTKNISRIIFDNNF
jgi:hypothetical protein